MPSQAPVRTFLRWEVGLGAADLANHLGLPKHPGPRRALEKLSDSETRAEGHQAPCIGEGRYV